MKHVTSPGPLKLHSLIVEYVLILTSVLWEPWFAEQNETISVSEDTEWIYFIQHIFSN